MPRPDLQRIMSFLSPRRPRAGKGEPKEPAECEGSAGTLAELFRQEGRRQERAAVMRFVPYEMREFLGEDSIVIHQGEALSLNISAGGMLLMMDQALPARQVLELHMPASTVVNVPTLVEVCWTRPVPIEDDAMRYLVGVKFLEGRSCDPKARVA